MKFCRDCENRIPHSLNRDRMDLSLCAKGIKPDARADYMVTGEGNPDDFTFCSTMRIKLVEAGGCGPDAAMFKPTPPTPLKVVA